MYLGPLLHSLRVDYHNQKKVVKGTVKQKSEKRSCLRLIRLMSISTNLLIHAGSDRRSLYRPFAATRGTHENLDFAVIGDDER